jgi:GTP cyclohydrolase II
MTKARSPKPIVLTTHPRRDGPPVVPIVWGAPEARQRGPVIGTLTTSHHRNVIGTHAGSYAVYRALAVAAGALKQDHVPDLTNTAPVQRIGPHPSWHDPEAIVSLDPYGAVVDAVFSDYLQQGYDIRPTIAITKAHINVPELAQAVDAGRLQPDGRILLNKGECVVTKAAIEPVWHLPGVAERFGISENELRRSLFEQTAGMFPELVTRPDLKVFLPPIGGMTVYVLGDPTKLADRHTSIACRVHDECNGSDVFGSDICTCRPYLTHGIEVCVATAQQGGVGVIVYNRKEGRALGEVTKFLVYNARKRQAGGDSADQYFARTECVAGVQDMRFQELMPDVLRWLGIRKIDQFVSMSHMKRQALEASGVEIGEQVTIPPELVPPDAQVEIDAKIAAGYFAESPPMSVEELRRVRGRTLDES